MNTYIYIYIYICKKRDIHREERERGEKERERDGGRSHRRLGVPRQGWRSAHAAAPPQSRVPPVAAIREFEVPFLNRKPRRIPTTASRFAAVPGRAGQ